MSTTTRTKQQERSHRLVTALTRLGISVYGTRVLFVRGRTSGQWRSAPVNLLRHEGEYFLLAPRGATQWVHNLRVAGQGTLQLGRRTRHFEAEETADSDKPEILRAYLRRWRFEMPDYFEAIDADSSHEQLLRRAGDYPVFRLTMV